MFSLVYVIRVVSMWKLHNTYADSQTNLRFWFSLTSRAGHQEQADAANNHFELPDLGMGPTLSDAHPTHLERETDRKASNSHIYEL